MPVTQVADGQTPPQGQPQGAPAAQGDPSNQTPPSPPSTPQRPDGLPDSFWDEKAGPKINELVGAYNELAAERTKFTEAFKDFPEKVEDAGKFYKLPEEMLPEGVKLPDGIKFEPNTDLLNRALPILHQHKIPPAAFQDLTRAFNAYELERFQNDMKSLAEDAKKLGEKGPARRQELANRLTAIVGPERAKFIDTSALSSGAVEFFEELFSKITNQNNVVPLNQNRDSTPPPPPERVEDRWYGGQQQKAS